MSRGEVGERDTAGRVHPGQLPTGAVVTEGKRRIGVAEAAVVPGLVAGYHDAEPPADRLAEYRVRQLSRTHPARIRQRLRGPDLLAVADSLVELWDSWGKESTQIQEPIRRSFEMRVEEARSALAKAKGEK